MENSQIAQQLVAYVNEGVQSQNAYRVMLDVNGALVWHTQEKGATATHTTEPESTFWQRFMSGAIKMLPVEKQL